MLCTGGLSSQSAHSHPAGDTLGGNVQSVFKVHRHGLDVQLFITVQEQYTPDFCGYTKIYLFFLNVYIQMGIGHFDTFCIKGFFDPLIYGIQRIPVMLCFAPNPQHIGNGAVVIAV